MLRSTTLAFGVSFYAILLFSGCGGKPSLVYTEGTVKVDGKALPNASVQFHPLDKNGQIDHKLSMAVGQTDANGKFILSTPNEEGKGAFPGTYKVTVEAVSMPAMTEEQKKFPGAAVSLPVKALVHTDYIEAGKTPLKVTLPAPNLELEVKGPGK